MAFENTPLGELMGEKGYIRGPFGSALKRAELKKIGVPVYEQQHAIEGIRTFRYFIDDDKYSELRRFAVEANDLIISCSGTVGRISVIQAEDPKGIISQALLILRPDVNKILPYYLYYFLTSKAGAQELINASHGAVQLNIAPRNIVEKIPVPLPANVEIQSQIIRQLKVIDDKIDLNRRINQTLEAMAQAIFKSWFVDFDLVKAKIAAIEQGEDPLRAAMRAISGKTDAELDQMPREHHDQLAATAALFPDAMEASELGEIPKGWEAKRVGDLMELAYGKALKSTDRQEGVVPVYGSGGITGYHNEALVPHGAIIVGRKGTVGSLYWEDAPFFPIDTTFYIKPKAVPMTYCFYVMQTLGLGRMNTDAAVPGLNRENVYRLELVKPPILALNAFDGLVARMRKTMRENETEIQSLAQLRDTLLPKLISGELSINPMQEASDD